jgi:hypothetical protein
VPHADTMKARPATVRSVVSVLALGLAVLGNHLRQRPSQVCDTNIQGDSATVLRGGVRADLTVFGHSDDSATFLSRSDTSNDDRAKQKQRDQNQPTQGQCR